MAPNLDNAQVPLDQRPQLLNGGGEQEREQKTLVFLREREGSAI